MAEENSSGTAPDSEADRLTAMAEADECGLLAKWMSFLPINPNQKFMLAWIWEYQIAGEDCRLSYQAFSKALNIGQPAAMDAVKALVENGYVTKAAHDHGANSYSIDVPRCVKVAEAHGWEPSEGRRRRREEQEGNAAAANRAIGLLEAQLTAKDDEIRELHKLLDQSNQEIKKARKKAKRIQKRCIRWIIEHEEA